MSVHLLNPLLKPNPSSWRWSIDSFTISFAPSNINGWKYLTALTVRQSPHSVPSHERLRLHILSEPRSAWCLVWSGSLQPLITPPAPVVNPTVRHYPLHPSSFYRSFASQLPHGRSHGNSFYRLSRDINSSFIRYIIFFYLSACCIIVMNKSWLKIFFYSILCRGGISLNIGNLVRWYIYIYLHILLNVHSQGSLKPLAPFMAPDSSIQSLAYVCCAHKELPRFPSLLGACKRRGASWAWKPARSALVLPLSLTPPQPTCPAAVGEPRTRRRRIAATFLY